MLYSLPYLILMNGLCAQVTLEAVLSEASSSRLGASMAPWFQVRGQTMSDAPVLWPHFYSFCEIHHCCFGGIYSSDRDFMLLSWRLRCLQVLNCQINRWIIVVTVIESAFQLCIVIKRLFIIMEYEHKGIRWGVKKKLWHLNVEQ